MKSLQIQQLISATAASVLLALLSAGQAMAAPKGDYFSHDSNSTNSASSAMADGQAIVKWFEAADTLIVKYKPSTTDDVMLSRPINQDPQRLKQWISTAGKVSRNYRSLAAQLKHLPLPAAAGGIKEFRDLSCDWYNDAALVYEDLIRPCAPFATQEEMQTAMQTIKGRASSLAQTSMSLRSMDQKLRLTYQVHPPRHDDALDHFVSSR